MFSTNQDFSFHTKLANRIKEEGTNYNLPHASSVLEGVRAAVEGAIEMAVDLMLGLAALIEKSELKEGPDIGALAGQGDEDGDVGGGILGVFAVGVEVDGPIVASDGESVGGNVLSGAHALGERVAADGEVVCAIHGVVDRAGIGGVDHDHCIGMGEEKTLEKQWVWGWGFDSIWWISSDLG